jgi:hypothetical protein
MKFLKLVLSVATGWLLVGASGAAMAVDCASGSIVNTTVDEISVTGQGCLIWQVIVEGPVEINNGAVVVMIDNRVSGRVRVQNSQTVLLSRNTVYNSNLVIKTNTSAALLANVVVGGSIRVIDNTQAEVRENVASKNILCANNGKLDSFFNNAGGEEECRK